MKIYNSSNIEIVDLVVSDDSYRYRTIMGENALTLTFSLPEFVEIPVGSYCDFQAERYTLLAPQNFKKNSSRNFDYTLILQSSGGLLERYKFRDSGSKKLKFALTAKPHEHLEMLVWNLNQRDSGWSVGSYIDSVEKVINYNHTDCRSALRMMAENFNTEFEIIGKVISLKRVEYNKSNPLALSYGFGNGFKSGVKRDNSGTSKAIEILFVQGGERNIDAFEYGSSELLLPKNQTLVYEGRTYISDANGFSIKRSDKALSTKIEDSLDLSHIYPQRVGAISQVITVNSEKNLYDFTDNSIPADLDYSAQIIQGEKMSVVFQSGMLAGKEFDVSYNHASKKFAVVPQEIDGVTMPSSTFPIAVNDTYAVFGIKLPDSYVCNNTEKTGASWDMFREAAKYLYENEDPRFSFTGDLDEMWAKSDWLNIGGKIKLGGYVSFSDEQFQTSPVLIRITGIKDLINKPQKPQIELSNITVGGSTSSLIKDIPTKDVLINEAKKESIRFAKRGFREAKETAEMLQNSLLNFSGSINPITVQTMQLVAGDVSLQFKFVNSKTNPVEIAHSFDFDVSDKKFKTGAGIIQHMTLGITSVSSSHAVSEYKFWDIPAFESAVLDNTETGYYVYIKASKVNQTAAFYVSETPIAIESVTGYYHLLVGILNSEFEGDRSWAAMYGYSELSPSRLTVKKVVSPNGNTYFDLENEEIAGNIKFRAADNSLKSVEQGIQEVGRGNNIFPQAEFPNGIDDWNYGYSTSSLNVAQKGVNYSPNWSLNGNTNIRNNQGLNTAFMTHGGWADEQGEYAYLSSQSINGIQGGKKYIVSAYVGNHRADRVDIYIEFYNSNGSWLNFSGSDQPTCYCAFNEKVGGQNINGYKRIYAVVTAHQDAVSANVVIRKYGTAEGYTDSYMFVCRPMLEQVDDLTTKPGTWQPYASSGEITEVKNVANAAQAAAEDAASDAAFAITEANAANTAITAISSDNILSANEKGGELGRWNTIIAEKDSILNQAIAFGIPNNIGSTRLAFSTMFQNLANYLNAGITWTAGTPSWLANLTTNTTIVGSTYRSKWEAYYTARTNILNEIAVKAKEIAISTAATDATNKVAVVQSQLNDIASDSKLTPNEKQQVKREWDAIQKEVISIDTQSGVLGIDDTDYDSYADFLNYYFVLSAYLSPLLADLTTTSTIVASTFNTNFANCYSGIEGQRAAIASQLNIQSKAADYIRAAMGTTTDINGGLMATALLRMKDTANNINGGMSGLPDNIGFWTGGTYEDALASDAAPQRVGVIDRKDGSGHRAFGQILWDKFGAMFIGMFKIIGGAIIGYEGAIERIKLHTGAIRSVSELLSDSWFLFPQTWTVGNYVDFIYDWGGGQSVLSYSRTVERQISVPSATNIKIYAGSTVDYELQWEDYFTVTSIIESVKIWNGATLIGTYSISNSPSAILLPAGGTYNIQYIVEVNTYQNEPGSQSNITLIKPIPMTIMYEGGIAKTEVGKNGLFSWWSSINFTHISESGGFVRRGYTDIPAGLGGASINSSGVVVSVWGKITSTGLVVKSGSSYTITHNIGDTDYSLILTPKSTNVPYFLDANRGANTVVVTCAGGFDFVLIRTK